jgi:Tol biopolymer transport system component
MNMRFTLYLAVLFTLLLLFSTCKDKGNPVDDRPPNGGNPPCPPYFFCPPDFRVTDYEPAWSPNGTTIAYAHGDTVPGKTGIYFIEPSGQNKRLWYASVGAGAPSWSPDGAWIAFHDGAQIYKRKLNGENLTQLTTEGRNFFPAWSPDGLWLAYDSNVNDPRGANVIWKMLAGGSGKRDISQHGVGEWRMPNWSPNGRRIAHQRYVGVGAPEVVTMDTSGGDEVRLTFDDRFDGYPKYSPDGTRIAFTSQPSNGSPQIWVMNADGTNPRQLTTTQGYTCDWSPDGEWIVYTDSRAVNGRLWIMRKDGSGKRQLTFE